MSNTGQRRHKRYEVQDVHGALLFRTQVRVRNLSISGLALETPERLQPGRTYAIRLAGDADAVDVFGVELALRDGVVPLDGRVAFVQRDDAVKGEVATQIGMEFVEMSAGSRSRIAEFIATELEHGPSDTVRPAEAAL